MFRLFSLSPMQMVTAYSVFASGGYRPKPYFIERFTDAQGKILGQAKPERAGEGSERVIDARNAFIMTSIMRDVVKFGTAARAMQLNRQDLAGKTGTTNDQVDAWFAGFNADLVAVAWIGFDQPRSLGGAETGAQAALPIWMSYMGKVLKDVPERELVVPDGVVVARINAQTGLRVPDGVEGIPEYFFKENLPAMQGVSVGVLGGGSKSPEEVKDQLF